MDRSELKPAEVHYPETDGQPMAESDLHRDLMLDLIVAAQHHFRDVPDVYVSGNLLVYFQEGDPRMCVAPDCFVVRGIEKGRRRIYKVWEEGKGPELVVELTSPSTHLEDLGRKRAIYEELGVREYFIFDPEGIRFRPQLRGFRFEGGILEPVRPARKAGRVLVLPSEVVGLELHASGESLRWVDPRVGKPIPIPDELLEIAVAERKRADQEKRRAEREKKRAEAERGRADTAEAEVARLREELARLRGKRRG